MLGGGSPKKYNSMANPKFKSKGSLAKSTTIPKIHAHLEKYETYGDNSVIFEADVSKSCETYLNERADERAKADLHYAAS